MLHTLNKAWVDILARQLQNKKIKNFLCVYKTEKELAPILEAQIKYKVYISTIPADYIEYQLYNDRIYNINSEKRIIKILEDEIYDDILISHDLYDVFTKDFLSKHCAHKNS